MPLGRAPFEGPGKFAAAGAGLVFFIWTSCDLGDGCGVGCGGTGFVWTSGGVGGGGGIIPPGGPYWIMGRYMGCWEAGGIGGRGFGSLIANIEASKMCGSTVIVQVPSLVMESLEGLFAGCSTTPFFFTGFVQYFSNMPSLSHFCRDLCNESGRTPL